ncbi:MAG: NfeD family protein [Anaerolineae bacterium]|nr:NfeD family protein [Anaerolineae bacterium]
MDNLTTIEMIYWGAAIVGGTFFVLRTILMLVGMGHHDFDANFDGDIDHDIHFDSAHGDVSDHGDTSDHSDSDFSFKFLSLQGLTAFLMMFGLVGLTLLQSKLHIIVTLAGGCLAGVLTVRLLGLLFGQMKHLQSDGTLDIQNAVGQSGSVYLTIPGQGTGQVQVPVQGLLRIFDAASKGEQAIPTGEKITVTGVVDNNTLIVERIAAHQEPVKK